MSRAKSQVSSVKEVENFMKRRLIYSGICQAGRVYNRRVLEVMDAGRRGFYPGRSARIVPVPNRYHSKNKFA
jgi:hypothetical protein